MESKITRLYRLRFSKDLEIRNAIWEVLCREFFQKYIRASDCVCDLGAGYCEFINNIKAKVKYALDINRETKKYAKDNINVVIASSTKVPRNLTGIMDVVFASNFFEHLPTKEDLAKTLGEIKKMLKKNGRLIILMPNLRYVGSSYWDFLDHQLPLTDKSMIEALELGGFKIIEKRVKFLPYSTKGKLPKLPFLVRIYLKMPILHSIFGKQSLIIAKKTSWS